jgi:flagellar hook-associated protein 3 FlgL
MISTKLFNDQSIDRFKAITREIQQTQAQISTGKTVLRASDDPVAAANIAFTKDQKVVLERYATNIERAGHKLGLVDTILGDATNVLTRVYELGIQASNDTLNGADRKAVASEVKHLKETLLGLANSKDQSGAYIFSGFKVHQMPFLQNSEASIEYHGDRGVHSVQVSESMKMNTSIDGAAVFLRSPTDGKSLSIFSILENLENSLVTNTINTPAIELTHKTGGYTAEGNETIQVNLVGASSGNDDKLTFTTSALTMGDNDEVLTSIKSAFDALSDKKGYKANLVSEKLTFTRSDGTNFSFEMTETGIVGDTKISLQARLDGGELEDLLSGSPTSFTDSTNPVGNIKKAIEHVSLQRTTVGAQMNKGNVQRDVISNRLSLMNEKLSSLADADIAALVTKLQSQIIGRDAAQQSFVKIGQQSLFDYIR